jgi:hypothetical protein
METQSYCPAMFVSLLLLLSPALNFVCRPCWSSQSTHWTKALSWWGLKRWKPTTLGKTGLVLHIKRFVYSCQRGLRFFWAFRHVNSWNKETVIKIIIFTLL